MQIHGFDGVDFDPDSVPRRLFSVGSHALNTNWELDFHTHRKSLLLLNVRGMITCQSDNGFWSVPPHTALWIPAGCVHSANMARDTECYAVFIQPDLASALPRSSTALAVTPLMRELIIRSSSFPLTALEDEAQSRICSVLFDELIGAPRGTFFFPLPVTARLKQLAEMLRQNAADRSSIAIWAERIGMSERSLTRHLRNEIGMSFVRWRRQLHIVLALQKLYDGISVDNIAADLGYDSAASFITMFKSIIGVSPARHLQMQATH